MPKIQPDYDPFRRESLYQKLSLDPFAPTYEIEIRLKELAEEIEYLPEEEKEQKQALLDEARAVLLDPRKRVLRNAVEIDPINRQHLVKMLTNLPAERRVDSLTMPQLDLSRVIIEGESPDIAQVDFAEVNRAPEMEIDFEEVNTILRSLPEVRHFEFDT